jgi:exopolyphosphatase / guanosine-5'-triphosphate,3'-diphosphate pyrophosphatase
MSGRYFDDGAITEKRVKRARLAARLELEPVQAAFKSAGWNSAVGSSGTIRAVGDVLRSQGQADGSITANALETILEQCVRIGDISRLKLPGLTDERAPVFIGGLTILAELFSVLQINSMRVAEGALREGLLYDLVGRLRDEDARVRSVRAMQARYHVDTAQAARVEATARNFLEQVHQEWELMDPFAESVLSWSAQLHEIGLDVSHSHYQKHGAYLLEHADMPGFPQEEQRILANIVGAHRRKVHLEQLHELNPPWHIKAEYLIVLLRLAVLLHRGRSPVALPTINLRPKARTLEVAFPKGWLDEHPLSAADLETEIDYLKAAGFKLKVV